MSKYSRRHYQDVAKIIANEFCWARDSYGVQQEWVFDTFNDLFKKDNDRYNSDMFRKACDLQVDHEDYKEDRYLQTWRDKLWKETLDENPQVREEYEQKQIEMGILHEQLNPREDGDY
tara:strand:+ start:872 stop:1225 length:354 start_codon:yes stop_codon:yes gene_type:complete